MKTHSPKPQRCAIYTRKSTEHNLDLAFNSLDAQREAGEAYIASQRHEGWYGLPDRYDDGGFTGGNIDRPAMRRLLADAGKPDRPGLFISRNCSYFWETVPYLGRDIKRVEDVDSAGPDHAADAVRYGVLRQRGTVGTTRVRGVY